MRKTAVICSGSLDILSSHDTLAAIAEKIIRYPVERFDHLDSIDAFELKSFIKF